MFRKFAVLGATALIAVNSVAAQRRTAPVRPKPVQTVRIEISDADWKALGEALMSENWSAASQLANAQYNSLKSDNRKKQLAQLRYLRIFALAGMILEQGATRDTAAAEKLWLELDRVVVSFTGKEIVIPPRQFVEDCADRLNYICAVKTTPRALRTTATNQSGSAIHSFDYVSFDGLAPELKMDGTVTRLGGTLEKAEYNDDPAKPWVLRLFLIKGFVFEIK
jgi:hypothetical protein